VNSSDNDDDDDDESIGYVRPLLQLKQSRACWWHDLKKSSVFGSRWNEDGRWQLL